MGLKDVWNKVTNSISGVNDEDDFETDEFEDEEDVVEERQNRRSVVPSNVTVDRSKHDYGDFSAAQLAWNNGDDTPQK